MATRLRAKRRNGRLTASPLLAWALAPALLLSGGFFAVAQENKPEGQPAAANADITSHEKAGNCVEGTEQTCLALTRTGNDGKQRRILVIRTGTSDDTGIYAICGPRDTDPEGTPNIGVFSESGAGGIRIVIDKNVVRVPLAQVVQNPVPEGQSGSDGSIEASAGTAKLLDSVPEGRTERLAACGVEYSPKPTPDTVQVTQGQTRLSGQKLSYNSVDGIARIDGPITFKRDNPQDPLSGKSQRIEVDVDGEKTVLVGGVELSSKDGRVSTADRVEYDDTRNEARLYATPEHPAESRKGKEWLRVTSGYIYYNLSKNEVSVPPTAGAITGDIPESESGE